MARLFHSWLIRFCLAFTIAFPLAAQFDAAAVVRYTAEEIDLGLALSLDSVPGSAQTRSSLQRFHSLAGCRHHARVGAMTLQPGGELIGGRCLREILGKAAKNARAA